MLRRRVEPAPPGHDDVEQDDVRLVQPRLADRLLGVARLVLDGDVLLGLEQQTQPRADERVVVDDQDADHVSGTSATKVVPAPGRDSIASRPPSSADALPHPEQPDAAVAARRPGSNPTPSSSTTTDTASSLRVRTTLTLVGPRVLDDVRQRLLHDPVERGLDLGREPADAERGLRSRPTSRSARAKLSVSRSSAGDEAEVVERLRPELDRQPADVLERRRARARAPPRRPARSSRSSFRLLDGRAARAGST